MSGCGRHVLHSAAGRYERIYEDRIFARPANGALQFGCDETGSITGTYFHGISPLCGIVPGPLKDFWHCRNIAGTAVARQPRHSSRNVFPFVESIPGISGRTNPISVQPFMLPFGLLYYSQIEVTPYRRNYNCGGPTHTACFPGFAGRPAAASRFFHLNFNVINLFPKTCGALPYLHSCATHGERLQSISHYSVSKRFHERIFARRCDLTGIGQQAAVIHCAFQGIL